MEHHEFIFDVIVCLLIFSLCFVSTADDDAMDTSQFEDADDM